MYIVYYIYAYTYIYICINKYIYKDIQICIQKIILLATSHHIFLFSVGSVCFSSGDSQGDPRALGRAARAWAGPGWDGPVAAMKNTLVGLG